MSTSNEKSDPGTIEKNLDMLYARREALDAARAKHSDLLDKYLLTFATGSLYLSINFTSGLNREICQKWPLLTGWILLLISIISILASFYCGEEAHARQIEINDQWIKSVLDNEEIEINEVNKWNRAIGNLKLTSITSFIFGICLLTYFYFINL